MEFTKFAESVKLRRVHDGIHNILLFIGEDPEREGLKETPFRMIRSWKELFSGYKQNPADVLKVFAEGACDEMVILKDVEFYSHCEHHFLPFFGKVHIGYIPNKRVVGVSKLARLTEIFARRLQIQERMTAQIADSLMEHLEPLGVMVMVEAVHFCMTSRGIQKQNSKMITNAIRGIFLNNIDTRNEFLQTIKGGF